MAGKLRRVIGIQIFQSFEVANGERYQTRSFRMQSLQHKQSNSLVTRELRVQFLVFLAPLTSRRLDAEIGSVSLAQVAFVNFNKLRFGRSREFLEQRCVHGCDGLAP